MILEGIVTTLDESRSVNIAPMGPIVDASMSTLLLRPFTSSTTYRNLKQHGHGVFHVVDDVLLLARAAIGRVESEPETMPARNVTGSVLTSACRWYEFEVRTLDDSSERTHIETRVVHAERRRDFFGFNRAKHAVIEAAILATRLHLIEHDHIVTQYEALAVIVEKTAGPDEKQAFRLLSEYINDHPRVTP